MAYALIDNASLTAVERALGKVVVKTPDTINGDLTAVENFIQAILFYDDLVSIDNYKPEFSESRARDFSFVNFLSPHEYGLVEIDGLAKKEAGAVRPEIRGGQFVDQDFKELLELLKMNMVCTWDMRSSVYYLTMKMLGQPYTPEYEKYSELSAAIFNELSDAGVTRGRWSKDVKLVSSTGRVFNDADFGNKSSEYGGVTNALQMFVAALNWLAYKSIYYSLAAKHLQADSFIHPIRHAYQLHWMKKSGAFGHDFTARLIKNLSHKVSDSISDVIGHGRPHAVALEIPIFSAWLTQASGSLEQALKAALELKKTDQFVVARETMKEIKIAYDECGLAAGNKRAAKLEGDLRKIGGDLRRAYGVPSDQGIQGSFFIKVINFAVGIAGIPSLPDKEFAISTPEFLKSRRTKAFATIFKDVTNELTSIERLGGVRDKMTNAFKVDEEFYVRPKTEDPKFRKSSSHWKIPM